MQIAFIIHSYALSYPVIVFFFFIIFIISPFGILQQISVQSSSVLFLLPSSVSTIHRCLIIALTMTDNERIKTQWSKTENMNNFSMLVRSLRCVSSFSLSACVTLCDCFVCHLACGRGWHFFQRSEGGVISIVGKGLYVCVLLQVHMFVCLNNIS